MGDESVEVRLSDEANLLDSTWGLKGVVFYHPLAVQLESVRRVLISEDGGYVLAAEEWCAVFCRDMQPIRK